MHLWEEVLYLFLHVWYSYVLFSLSVGRDNCNYFLCICKRKRERLLKILTCLVLYKTGGVEYIYQYVRLRKYLAWGSIYWIAEGNVVSVEFRQTYWEYLYLMNNGRKPRDVFIYKLNVNLLPVWLFNVCVRDLHHTASSVSDKFYRLIWFALKFLN